MIELKNKKVLLVGLGILGGGLSMANHLLKKGAQLTVTDLRTKKQLADTLKELPKSVKYTLGKHKKKDFEEADLIIFNPAVSILSEWAQLAKSLGKPFFNDYTYFLENAPAKANTIGITGTRGKTTTTLWTNHLIEGSVIGGNIPGNGLFKVLEQDSYLYVLELSSYQLEYVLPETPAPHIAVVTNIYNDHLNRYGNIHTYASFKYKIFENQVKKDYLILNLDEKVTTEILGLKPKSKILFVSDSKLSKDKEGLYADNGSFIQVGKSGSRKVLTFTGLSRHERANLMCAALCAHLSGVSWQEIQKKLDSLPTAPLRQEIILDNKNLKVVNDSAGTSPDAVIAAIEKFSAENDFVLITGGTDKELDYTALARKISDCIPPNRLYFLSGTGTEKLKKELTTLLYSIVIPEFDSLEKLVRKISANHKTGTIVFSPGGSSFELFKNEFDRGEKFTKLVKKYYS